MPPPTKQPHQPRLPTLLPCLRLRNINLRDPVLPLAERCTVYVGVLQQR